MLGFDVKKLRQMLTTAKGELNYFKNESDGRLYNLKQKVLQTKQQTVLLRANLEAQIKEETLNTLYEMALLYQDNLV